jgi:hypothetical protein
MVAPMQRRGFLRGLVSLPLIGGGVTLIGSPTAVAEPCSLSLLDRYTDWLAVEYGEALIERCALAPSKSHSNSLAIMKFRREWVQDNRALNPRQDRFESAPAALPSTRAALVLSAVGCNWREGSSWW